MKPTLVRDYPGYEDLVSEENNVFVQRKLNGWRCIIDIETGVLYSRTEKILDMPHISNQVKSAFKNLKNIRYVDGELYCHGRNLHKIQSMIKLKDTRIEFHCFDVISTRKFSDRLKSMFFIKPTENIKIIETEKIKTNDIQKTFKKYISEKYEGLIIRLDGFSYTSGRTEHLFRIKEKY